MTKRGPNLESTSNTKSHQNFNHISTFQYLKSMNNSQTNWKNNLKQNNTTFSLQTNDKVANFQLTNNDSSYALNQDHS